MKKQLYKLFNINGVFCKVHSATVHKRQMQDIARWLPTTCITSSKMCRSSPIIIIMQPGKYIIICAMKRSIEGKGLDNLPLPLFKKTVNPKFSPTLIFWSIKTPRVMLREISLYQWISCLWWMLPITPSWPRRITTLHNNGAHKTHFMRCVIIFTLNKSVHMM